MVHEKEWKEFQESGLLWYVNMILHAFGWAIVVEPIQKRIYPARVKFRGFSEATNTKGYQKLSEYMCKNAEEIRTESYE